MFTELEKNQFHTVSQFFADSISNAVVARALINGNNPGKIWVNVDANAISACLVITKAGYALIDHHKTLSNELIADLISILKKHAPVKLVYQHHDFLYQQLIDAGFTSIPRVQLYHPEVAINDLTLIQQICAQLPPDCELKQIDQNNISQCNWLPLIHLCYGNDENFLQHGFGVALFKDSELISEAFSAYVDDEFVETASMTKPEYRKQGYATIARAFLIKEAAARHLIPITSCNVDNPASFYTSKKLGYVESMQYEFLSYSNKA